MLPLLAFQFDLTSLLLHVAGIGAEWVLWLLVALSVLSIGIMIDRVWFFSRRSIDAERLGSHLRESLRAEEFNQARALVADSKAPAAIVVRAGLDQRDGGPEAMGEAMLGAKARQRLGMESKLAILGTLGANAPFIGLFGTVLGIIKASHDLTAAQSGEATQAAMSGIFEALVATAVGLFVAIPAVVAYNFFQRRVRSTLGHADALVHLVLSEVKRNEEKQVAVSPKSLQPVQVVALSEVG